MFSLVTVIRCALADALRCRPGEQRAFPRSLGRVLPSVSLLSAYRLSIGYRSHPALLAARCFWKEKLDRPAREYEICLNTRLWVGDIQDAIRN